MNIRTISIEIDMDTMPLIALSSLWQGKDLAWNNIDQGLPDLLLSWVQNGQR